MRRISIFFALLAALALLPAACAARLDTPNDGVDGGSYDADPDAAPLPPVSHEDSGNGVTTTRVDASSYDIWLYLELESLAQVEPGTPDMSTEWDLGFQRYHVKLNGGVSGMGGMEVAVLPGVAFDSITEAPAAGYLSDAPDGEDEGELPEYVISTGETKWYSYNGTNHVLTPNDMLYVVRSVEGNYYKLQMLAYYDDVGSPAKLRFQWAPIEAPPSPQ